MSDEERTLRDSPNRPGMRTALVAATAMFATTKGVSLERIQQATGLGPQDLIDPDSWLPEALVPAIWRLVSEANPGQAVALQMAQVAPISVFGPLLHVCRHAADIRAQMQAFVRYRYVLSDRLHMVLVEQDDWASIRFEHPMDAQDGGLGAEMGLALGARVGREAMGTGEALRRVQMRHPPYGPVEAYTAFFGVPVEFECAHNGLVYDAAILDRPATDPLTRDDAFIGEHLQAARAQLVQDKAGDIGRVHDAIAHNAERSEYGAEALARQVGMSLRNLQRLVRDHGTTVRALLERAREANARQLLSDSRLSVEEVSFLLGYSQDRAFRRAFKRWTGVTPAKLRRDARVAMTSA